MTTGFIANVPMLTAPGPEASSLAAPNAGAPAIAGADIIRTAQAEICRPWLRHLLHHADWAALAAGAPNAGWVLLAHWADTLQVHALFLDPEALAVVPVSTPVEHGRYPALSPSLPGAAWYERMVHDLWGHVAMGGADPRPWLDHGHWPQAQPMALRPEPQAPFGPAMLVDAGQEDAMVLPLGPIWGQLEEAVHLRLTLNGPVIHRAEALLGFTHKGALALMRGKSPRAAARFAARLLADATVAHSVAFAQATEAAMDVQPPPRATALRVAMMEIERIAVHLDNLAEVGRLAGAALVRTRCGWLREVLLRATDTAFGHRLMMDCVVPGGVAVDIAEGGAEAILRALGDIASELPALRHLHDAPALVSRLGGLGRVGGKLAASLGVGGIVGRASGHDYDVRKIFVGNGHSPTGADHGPRLDGDALSRQRLRVQEIEDSLGLVSKAFDGIAQGPVTIPLPHVSGEGIACAESPRGDVWHWLRLDHGQVAAVFPRDPGWALWPLAELALANAAVEDIELIRASLALPASGMDL